MNNKPYYAGIGSRKTPSEICAKMTEIASYLEHKGYILRSGGADGADLAFEAGVKDSANKKIYLPWENFNNSNSKLFLPKDYINEIEWRKKYELCDRLYAIAEKYHPNWSNLKPSVRRLMARNCLQIFGPTLVIPVKFVICWTPKDDLGGTGQAIRIAKDHEIPVYNLQDGPINLEEIISI